MKLVWINKLPLTNPFSHRKLTVICLCYITHENVALTLLIKRDETALEGKTILR